MPAFMRPYQTHADALLRIVAGFLVRSSRSKTRASLPCSTASSSCFIAAHGPGRWSVDAGWGSA